MKILIDVSKLKARRAEAIGELKAAINQDNLIKFGYHIGIITMTEHLITEDEAEAYQRVEQLSRSLKRMIRHKKQFGLFRIV